MKHSIILLLIAISSSIAAKSENGHLQKSIVQVRITYQNPNFIAPWKSKNPSTINAVGIVTSSNRILVLASMIEYATLIEVKKYSSYQYAKADIVKLDLEANMALLGTDSGFFKDLSPVEFKNEIPVHQPVKISQLDNAGGIQEAGGRVLILDIELYAIGHTDLPVIEVVSNEKFNGTGELVSENHHPVGILAFYNNSKSSGKVIPGPVINRFLVSTKPSAFDFKGFYYKPLIRKVDREFYGLTGEQDGIIVTHVFPWSSASGVLQPGDVITSFGGKKIDAKGYFDHPVYGKQTISYIVYAAAEMGFRDGNIPLEILRNKKAEKKTLPLKPFSYQAVRIPHRNYEWKNPQYIAQGGFVFLELSEFMLREWGKEWRNKVKKKLLYLSDFHHFFKNETQSGKIILLSQVLPDEANNGYQDLSLLIVRKVNGKKIGSLKEMKQAMDATKDRFISILLENGAEIVLDRESLQAIDQRIMKTYNLPALDNL